MNGFTEPLPGLLDDPQFQIPNLAGLQEVHIAPIRNPAPSRHRNAPLPLEPYTTPLEDHRNAARNSSQLEEEPENSLLRLKPSDVLSAREAKKPHLAISELLETTNDVDFQPLQLPSFVSLAVVEKSPVQEPSHLSPHKRLRLDLDGEGLSRDVARTLPRPAQKDGKQQRRVPLLPAMVTGLHEPPPSAGILPSMDPDAPPRLTRTTKTSKMQVKNILVEAKQSSTHVPPEAMLNTPDLPTVELAKPLTGKSHRLDAHSSMQIQDDDPEAPKKDTKARRARRKWTEQETADLLAGVKKHGFGRWKQILMDTSFAFQDRTSIDLKDRYRVYTKFDQPDEPSSEAQSQSQSQPSTASTATDIIRSTDSTSLKTLLEGVEITKPKRKRRPWTPAEDAALLRGVSKHGFQWTLIHDDAELDLGNRRATDLRDRIRNLYPDGYKMAEVRPPKSEAKKADRTVQDSHTTFPDSDTRSLTKEKQTVVATASQDSRKEVAASSQEKRKLPIGKVQKSAGDAYPAADQVGVTLPPLALDDDDELDWGDNTLPPLLEWEEIGM